MVNASIQKELLIETVNKVGVAGEITHLVADQAHSNIRALWAGSYWWQGCVFSNHR